MRKCGSGIDPSRRAIVPPVYFHRELVDGLTRAEVHARLSRASVDELREILKTKGTGQYAAEVYSVAEELLAIRTGEISPEEGVLDYHDLFQSGTDRHEPPTILRNSEAVAIQDDQRKRPTAIQTLAERKSDRDVPA